MLINAHIPHQREIDTKKLPVVCVQHQLLLDSI